MYIYVLLTISEPFDFVLILLVLAMILYILSFCLVAEKLKNIKRKTKVKTS